MPSQVGRWVARTILATIAALAVAGVSYRVYGSDGYVQLRRLRRQQADLARGNADLRQENQELRREIGRLRDDLSAIGAVAREELGMVAPGEVVIRIDRGAGSGALKAEGRAP